MRMNHMSLNRKWILFSLVLLSPAILAAENLNFNYTRADSQSVEPQLLKLGKVCHSRDDPMDIEVNFLPDMITDHSLIQLIITGESQRTGYTGFYTYGDNKASGSDPDFLLPWKVTLGGEGATIYEINNVTTDVERTVYDDPFCFSLKTGSSGTGGGYANSNGIVPLYSQAPFARGYSRKDFDKYCWDFTRVSGGENTYWPDYQVRPQPVIEGMAKPWDEYQGKYFFYRHKYSIVDGTETHKEEKTVYVKPEFGDLRQTGSTIAYYFPIINYDGQGILKKGNFRFTLSHRNISSLTLRLTKRVPGYDDVISDFTWRKDSDVSGLSNTLKFGPFKPGVRIVTAGDIRNDPYTSFYDKTGVKNSFFRGTLVADSSLNNNYKNYVKNISPLSLPAKSMGDINLLNTQKLQFVIGQDHQQGQTGGDYVITVFGQPMKFGPLYAGNQEMVSAMQVRNACY
ncbi:hypothetical protein GI007_24015 [Salmonella enterica]|nr:hypothetical protein [Salmonella enterica]